VCAPAQPIQGRSPGSPAPAVPRPLVRRQPRFSASVMGARLNPTVPYHVPSKRSRRIAEVETGARSEHDGVDESSDSVNPLFTRLTVVPPGAPSAHRTPHHRNPVAVLVCRRISTTGPTCSTVSCYLIVERSSNASSTFEANSNVACTRYLNHQFL